MPVAQQPHGENEAEVICSLGREMFGIFNSHRLDGHSTCSITNLSLEAAYRVQSHCLYLRTQAGDRRVGWKIGCTSAAIQEQFGLSQPIRGVLLAPYIYSDGVKLRCDDYVDCAIEPEFVFHIGTEIPPGTPAHALRPYVCAISPGIEVHNYRFWYGPPSSQELIASNGIHAGLVVGPPKPLPIGMDLEVEVASTLVNGELAASAACAEIMGSPWNSLAWLVQELSRNGEVVRAGDLVIPGSAVKLIHLKEGDHIEARFTSLGSCAADF